MEDIKFTYKDGVATCRIKYKGVIIESEAHCHPDDNDFESERVGCCIAEARAYIDLLKLKRDNEVIPFVHRMRSIHHNICSSKQSNPNSYEFLFICRELQKSENELTAINKEIAEQKKSLATYISDKEKFYQRMRKARNQ
jgi:hypothetical protein